MARRLDDLLNEADQLIEKKAAKAQAPATSPSKEEDDEVEKLANALLAEENVDTMSAQKRAPKGDEDWNLEEKVAHAISIVSVLSQIEELRKLGDFEKTASSKGFSQEEIDQFMGEKAAAAITAGAEKVKKLLPAALVAGGAGGLGYVKGQSSGKDKGYSQALNDVNQAFEQYSM